MVVNRAQHGLLDPEVGVGLEPVALAPIELLDCSHQAGISLLDQILERDTLVHVVLGHIDHEGQVTLDQLLAGHQVLVVATLHHPHHLRRNPHLGRLGLAATPRGRVTQRLVEDVQVEFVTERRARNLVALEGLEEPPTGELDPPRDQHFFFLGEQPVGAQVVEVDRGGILARRLGVAQRRAGTLAPLRRCDPLPTGHELDPLLVQLLDEANVAGTEELGTVQEGVQVTEGEMPLATALGQQVGHLGADRR